MRRWITRVGHRRSGRLSHQKADDLRPEDSRIWRQPTGRSPTLASAHRNRTSTAAAESNSIKFNGGGHRVGASDLNSKINSARRLRCTTRFTRPATTTARAIVARGQCTRSELRREIRHPNQRSVRQTSVCLGSYSYSAPRYSYSYSNRQAPVCVHRPSRPRTYQTMTSNANTRQRRPDDIRWAPFGSRSNGGESTATKTTRRHKKENWELWSGVG
ncbi:hypothetical protein Enr13x_67510 [Stieleria neptunia]|uniref:Uncharacterized protein n=1 Tax=Stieleria neptunia TaxID=2527979 RepID=A0A518I141_9BACT|nr:hypothetical protein Enr13x_67510 [Stieleria neptunia]